MVSKQLVGFFSRLSEKLFKVPDPMKIYSFSYWLYVFTGFWKYESPIRWKRNLYKLYQCVLVVLYGVSIIFFIIDAVLVRNDFEKLSFNLSSSFLVFVTLSKVSLLAREKDDLEVVHLKLEKHLHVKTVGESMEDQEIFRKRAEQLVLVTRLFYGLLVVAFPLRMIADTALDSRSYLIPIPFKEKLDPHYEIVYGQQFIVIFHFLVTVIGHDMLVYAVVLRFIAHFEVLEKNFLNIKNLYPKKGFEKHIRGYREMDEKTIMEGDVLIRGRNRLEIKKALENYRIDKVKPINTIENKEMREKKANELLRENINHHQILLQEIKNFSRIYSLPLLVQACGAGFLIGIVVLQIIILSSHMTILLLQQILYVVTTMLNILHLCSFASELTAKSRAAANALYETPWHEMDVKNRMMVHFTIKKLIDAPKLRGGGVIVVNKVTYLKFLQISYNMVAVLRNLLHNKSAQSF